MKESVASRPATCRREVGSSSQPRQDRAWRNACELVAAEMPRSFQFTVVTSSFVHVVNVLQVEKEAKWAMDVRGGEMGRRQCLLRNISALCRVGGEVEGGQCTLVQVSADGLQMSASAANHRTQSRISDSVRRIDVPNSTVLCGTLCTSIRPPTVHPADAVAYIHADVEPMLAALGNVANVIDFWKHIRNAREPHFPSFRST